LANSIEVGGCDTIEPENSEGSQQHAFPARKGGRTIKGPVTFVMYGLFSQNGNRKDLISPGTTPFDTFDIPLYSKTTLSENVISDSDFRSLAQQFPRGLVRRRGWRSV
jgi:hypothetical protein